jgi:hypothetical protein
MKKYKTDSCQWIISGKIEEVEVERETASSIWINGRRNSKVGDFYMYFDTWDDAHAFLKKRCDEKVAYAKNQVLVQEKDQQKVLAMVKP